MFVSKSSDFPITKTSDEVVSAIGKVSGAELRGWVKWLSVPRHFVAQPRANRDAAEWIAETLGRWNYNIRWQGPFSNILAMPPHAPSSMLLVGAHYDSVSTTPGADDNASAVAAMLGCAKICSEMPSPPAIGFVAFNREEDGLAGSRDFVRQYLPAAGFTVSSAHILEMVGYASHQPGSQRLPEKLPIRVPDIGNFLALLANRDSGREADAVLSTARSYLPDFPVLSLKVSLGLERIFPVLARSDHAPFWDARIPATMWTDTSEFRNPNYHMPSDTPDTLDYTFLANVTKLLSAHVISSAHPPPPGGTPR